MLENTLIAVTSYGASIILLALWSGALAIGILWLGKLQTTVVLHAVRQCLRQLRYRRFFNLGLNPSRPRIDRMTRLESLRYLSDPHWRREDRPARRPRWYPPNRLTATPDELGTLLPDLDREDLDEAARDIKLMIPRVQRRVLNLTRFTVFLLAVVFSAAFSLDALRLPAHMLSGEPFFLATLSLSLDLLFVGGVPRWDILTGILVSASLTSALASPLVSQLSAYLDARYSHVASARSRPNDASGDEHIDETDMVGRKNDAIRAISFSGGAFDTIMQLGVAHALCVAQARPPDAVVGLSAGSLNAVALAEIMQAGEEAERAILQWPKGTDRNTAQEEAPSSDTAARLTEDTQNQRDDGASDSEHRHEKWSKLSKATQLEVQRARLIARSERLRFYIESAQRAPERLIDALMPDSYQPYSFRPLQPLQQPRFSPKERREKERAVIARSGLIRLYNDILGIPLPIATLTRVIRRCLGYAAANDLPNRLTRGWMKASEGLHLWILAGANLVRLAPLVLVGLRGLRSARVGTATAGSLIFRSLNLQRIGHVLKSAAALFAIAHLWAVPSALVGGVVFFSLAAATTPIVSLGVYFFTIVVLIGVAERWLLSRRLTALPLGSAIKAALALMGLVAAWTAALLMIDGILVYTFSPDRGQALAELTRILQSPTSSFLAALIPSRPYFAVLVGCLVVLSCLLCIMVSVRRHKRPYTQRLLAFYNLCTSILSTHEIRDFLVTLFDPDYYVPPTMDQIVDASLERTKLVESGVERQHAAKVTGHYSQHSRLDPIHVGIGAANTATGRIDILPTDTTVVDSLLAANALTPLFPPKEIKGELYVDGTKVSREPTSGLLRFLRNRVNEKSKIVHIYSVVPFPMSDPGLRASRPRNAGADGSNEGPLVSLVDVVLRAAQLQRYRDATVEHKLTHLFNRVIPFDDFQQEITDDDGNTKRFFRAWITPIERKQDTSIIQQILWKQREERRQAIAETIADGCRAALEVMVHDGIEHCAPSPSTPSKKGDGEKQQQNEKEKQQEQQEQSQPLLVGNASGAFHQEHGHFAKCRDAVRKHIALRLGEPLDSGDENARLASLDLPGSDAAVGPGLSEICRHCRLFRDKEEYELQTSQDGTSNGEPADNSITLQHFESQSLRLSGRWIRKTPPWPHEREGPPKEAIDDAHFERERVSVEEVKNAFSDLVGQWPRAAQVPPDESDNVAPPSTPTVSFLFGGGVFRGVYQLGVLNGLNQIGLNPDIVAGASVGSITAAMVADAFSRKDPDERQCQIYRLAAVYLAVDHLVLTDRFADFIRDLTLRAAETRFSIRQADRLFRKYDYPAFREFDRNARRVVAGIERLLYINPYQLNALVQNLRNRDTRNTATLLQTILQQILDRSEVGVEALGAEPLTTLIEAYVTQGRGADGRTEPTFDDFRRQTDIYFLATATNLMEGTLEILGRPRLGAKEFPGQRGILREGLLASSAFPGIFRPRWSWEVYPETTEVEPFIDGGVMDNLPLDAVAKLLSEASQARLIVPRPSDGASPHLVVAGSLEINAREYKLPATRREFQHNWLELSKRNGELKYNRKLDSYAATEYHLRELAKKSGVKPSDLVDMTVVPVKPEWLCSTYGFHPMLGFRRERQKKSIAHGCASTLLTFARQKESYGERTLRDWGAKPRDVPNVSNWSDAFQRLPLSRARKNAGKCWLRDAVCPFSEHVLRSANLAREPNDRGNFGSITRRKVPRGQPLSETMIRELSEIYDACCNHMTHLRNV